MVLDALNCKALLWTAPGRECKPGWRVLRRYVQLERERASLCRSKWMGKISAL